MHKFPRLGLLALLLGSAACQTPAIVRTARTLPEGEGDVSLAVNVTRISVDETEAEQAAGVDVDTSFTYPNLVPDLLYNYGITDDFEFGGRLSLASGMLEANVKYRYLQSDDGKLHMAVAPAVGYRALFLVSGVSLTLPLLFTYDLTPAISVSGGPLASYNFYTVDDDFATENEDDVNLDGDLLFLGGGIGIEFRTRNGFHFMPGIEFQRSVSRSIDGVDDPAALNFLFFGVTLGWGPRPRSQPVEAVEAPAGE